MRLLVNLLLILPTAAGPSLCCCTASKLFTAATRENKSADKALRKGPSHVCCHTHSHRKSDRVGGTGQRPTTNPAETPDRHPGDKSCPCQESRGEPVPAVVKEGDSRLTLGARAFLDFAPLAVDPFVHPSQLAHGLSAADPAEPRLPFLSATQRLRAHHALRC
jgi:hypothetical protein